MRTFLQPFARAIDRRTSERAPVGERKNFGDTYWEKSLMHWHDFATHANYLEFGFRIKCIFLHYSLHFESFWILNCLWIFTNSFPANFKHFETWTNSTFAPFSSNWKRKQILLLGHSQGFETVNKFKIPAIFKSSDEERYSKIIDVYIWVICIL